MVVTPDQIKTQILAGTYPANTVHADNVFTFKQYVRRRRYPSVEIEVTTPLSTEETQDRTNTIYSFQIHFFNKNLGQQTDEVVTIKQVEDVIMAQLEAMTLQDHKVVLEQKIWDRRQYQRDGDHPAYMESILKITVRQVKQSSAPPDGVLIFKLTGSSVDSPPPGDYTYVKVTNVDINEGYQSHPEQVTSSPIGPGTAIHYAGGFRGKFIAEAVIGAADIGSTGEKLNKLMTLRSNGEKPEVRFQYTNKTNSTTPQTITETVNLRIDYIQRMYRTQDNIVYRIVADIITPSTISVS